MVSTAFILTNTYFKLSFKLCLYCIELLQTYEIMADRL